jgi:hypothetical protein
MIRRIIYCIPLVFLLLCSSAQPGEQSSVFAAELQASLASGNHDFVRDGGSGSALLNRSGRGKYVLKAWAGPRLETHKRTRRRSSGETSRIGHSHKPDVYQQTNVYRL